MNTIKFHSGQSFDEVRKLITDLNRKENRNMIAHLTWRDGTAKDQTVVYLYDAMAERFGHTVDKESIGVEIVSSLMNGIPVEIDVSPKKA
ncbi:MAG TPA: hypothetical protein VF678_05345 [bacterium]